MEKFFRTELLLGKDKFQKIQNSFVIVIGQGAVGGAVTEALVRAGVGKIRLIDFDKISETNINRCIYALEGTVGRKKVEVAEERMNEINSDCIVEALDLFVAAETVEEACAGSPDFVIDAIDSANPKVELLEYLYLNEISAISSMGAALKTDPFSVRSADLMETTNCMLAKRLRKMLRRRGVGKGIQCVYSEQSPLENMGDKEYISESDYERGRLRRSMGSLPTLTGIFGLTIAQMVLNRLIED